MWRMTNNWTAASKGKNHTDKMYLQSQIGNICGIKGEKGVSVCALSIIYRTDVNSATSHHHRWCYGTCISLKSTRTVNTRWVLIPHDCSTLHTTEFRSRLNALWDSAFATHTRRIKGSTLQDFSLFHNFLKVGFPFRRGIGPKDARFPQSERNCAELLWT